MVQGFVCYIKHVEKCKKLLADRNILVAVLMGTFLGDELYTYIYTRLTIEIQEVMMDSACR